MIIRVRSKDGMWRVKDISDSTLIRDIQERIQKEYGVPTDEQRYFRDQSHAQPLSSNESIGGLKLKHGDVVYLDYDGNWGGAASGAIHKKKISADGSIIQAPTSSKLRQQGFRPGMMALRDIKMHWTIGEFMEMDSQFEFKIKRQKEAHCARASLDTTSCNDFQAYVRRFAFQRSRCALLYGTIDRSSNAVVVECIYEPRQRGYPEGFELLEDPHSETAEFVAKSLGFEKVGWMFSHPPREEGFRFTSSEIIMSAQQQLDAGGHGSPFVTVTVTLDDEGQATFDAYQMSDQCMEMVASGALAVNPDEPNQTLIQETFTAIVEGKESNVVDNDFFLTLVPIAHHESFLHSTFPKANREEGPSWSAEALKVQLELHKDKAYVERISDFQLLCFLCKYLDPATEVAAICQSVSNKEIPLDSGFPLIIDSLAGLS